MNKQTANLLEQHFDTAFAAPDGIKKLRELILMLAMQGKLVEQDANDPPASELLKEIEAEKQRLHSSSSPRSFSSSPRSFSSSPRSFSSSPRRRGSSKPLPLIKPEEVPYQLPQGWEWVRLGAVMQFINGDRGKNYPSKDKLSSEGIPFISAVNLRNGTVSQDNLLCVSEAQYQKLGSGKLEKNDLVFCIRGSLGKKAIYPFDIGAIASSLVILRRYLNEDAFLHFVDDYMSSPFLFNEIRKYDNGTAQPNLSANNFMLFLLPLPPLPEQLRIVARLDQWMTRCDELEKLRAEREQKRCSVHSAALKQLLDAQAGDSFADAWQFINQHFSELYTVKENVTELRKAILQLAVMGKLVPQNPNDPPASQLLKEIEAEKKRLVKEGKIKAPKPLPEINAEEVPYVLPQGWEWVRLQDVLDVRDGTHDSPKDAVGPDTYPLITSKNFSNGQIDFSDARTISAEDHLEISKRSKVERLDILFSMIGGNIGNQVIVQEDRDFSIKNVALFKYYSKELTYPYFIKRFMEHLASDLQLKAVGGAQPFVSLGFLRNIVIGLPSVNEQHRIVARIDQLMALCDTLDQQIDAAAGKQTKLLNAVMAQV